jgi:hypothetical protein
VKTITKYGRERWPIINVKTATAAGTGTEEKEKSNEK